MLSIKYKIWTVMLWNNETGETIPVIDFNGYYKNLFRMNLKPVITNEEDAISSMYVAQVRELEKEQYGDDGFGASVLVLAECYKLFMERNQPMNVAVWIHQLPHLKREIEAALRKFNERSQLIEVDPRLLSAQDYGRFHGMILENWETAESGRNGIDYLRFLRPEGRLLMYGKGADTEKENQSEAVQKVCFGNIWLQRMDNTGWLHLNIPDIRMEEEAFRQRAELCLKLWDQIGWMPDMIRGKLWVTEKGRVENLLREVIGLLHAMEGMIAGMYESLYNLEMKNLTNRLKTAVMDLLVELSEGGEEADHFAQCAMAEIKRYGEAIKKEFGNG